MESLKLQERLLNQCISTKVPVTIFTTNGVKMQGLVTSYDAYTITLQGQGDGRQNVLFKSAVSTVVPLKPVSLK
ncbi:MULTISPECIES: RNA chaperone Hfq [Paenibacillus]|uniref:RNA chaperone Hfq n=2 Tax=Paenibacillus TaxID=44249 RepID=A0A089MP22_PAEBO|nr:MULTISPECIES: RNA chaperone Hfq [Paenibacillus]NOU78260.1 RNA chaperone Hfq [Paenibacillus phytohabitans]AIQ29521.1 RNA chaperone Hfq [Paenibacillus sp. FSL P4-0081]AIQ41212.1 RNA chaperone Hfq [Paenibacillus sp. FSL R5-0912]AIQ58259.1 RNA chaperone Hfq [Paenibacillus borealis]KHL95535.1 RNA chaperone Hfq [Paenibacillus sp. IHB B 3415]